MFHSLTDTSQWNNLENSVSFQIHTKENGKKKKASQSPFPKDHVCENKQKAATLKFLVPTRCD